LGDLLRDRVAVVTGQRFFIRGLAAGGLKG
jgi:hypothetical protein